MKDCRRILFINLDRIGDVVRSTFIFRALRVQYPDAYIACLVAEPANEILSTDPTINDIFVLPHQALRALAHQKKTVLHMALPVFELFDALAIHDFDLVINPFSEFGAIAVRYLKPQYMLGRALDKKVKMVVYGEETAKFIYLMSNRQGMRADLKTDFVHVYARILHDLGIEVADQDMAPSLHVGSHHQCFADNFFKEHGIDKNDVVIGMQVGAFTEKKRWPISCFRVVAEILQREYNAKIIVNGSLHEAQTIIQEMIEPMKQKPIIAAGKTGLMQAAAVIKQCNLFISNDTGPMHIAATVEVPIIALFGSQETVHLESKPWGTQHTLIVQKDVKDISVDCVLDVARSMIKKQRAEKSKSGV